MSATSIYVPSQSSNCLLPLLKRSAIVISKRPRLLSNQCLCWDSELVRVCICPLRVKYLFLDSYGSPVCKVCWPSKPDILGISCLLVAGLLGWGAWYETHTRHSLGRTSASMFILLVSGSPTWECKSWLYYISALLPISPWFLLYVFNCGKYFLFVCRSVS